MLCWFKLKAYFLLESSFITFRPLIRSLAVLLGTFTVENSNVSSANNLVLHWRLSDKLLMDIRNKIKPNTERWGTLALILA